MKKIISILVVLTMLLGSFSMISAFAADASSAAITPDTSWHDGDVSGATNSTFVLKDAADLLGFAKIISENKDVRAFSGDTVKLDADIDLNPGWDASTGVAPTNVWPEVTSYFAGTFDGQGHTVKGIYQTSTKAGCGGIFGMSYGKTIVVKNLTVLNSYSESNQTQGHGFLFGHLSNASDVTIENVYVDAYVVNKATSAGDSGVGGLFGGYQSNDANVGITLKNSVFAGNIVLDTAFVGRFYVGGLAGRYNAKGTNTVENCGFFGSITVNAPAGAAVMAGKLLAYQSCAPSTMIIKDCIAAGNIALKSGEYSPVENGAAVGIVFGEAVAAARYNNGFSTVAFNNVVYTGTYPLLGCGYQQGTKIHTADPAEGDIKYYTGSIASDPAPVSAAVTDDALKGTGASSALTENNLSGWGAVENAYVLPMGIINGPVEDEPVEDIPLDITVPANADISWYKSSKNEYVLEDAADFLGFGYILASHVGDNYKTFEGKTVKLAADIDLNPGWSADGDNVSAPSVIWPVNGGENRVKFCGTFDGQGHTVKGLYETASNSRAGLFGYVPLGAYAAVKNVNIVNSYIKSSVDGVGGIFGVTDGGSTTIISNVYCDVNIVSTADTCEKYGVGGIIGGASWNAAVYNLLIENTVFAGDITVSFVNNANASNGLPMASVGGIIGCQNTKSLDSNGKSTNFVRNCAFYGTIKGVMPEDGNVGGIVGLQMSNGLDIENCISAGSIEITGNTFGFVGAVYGNVGPEALVTVKNTLYTGDVGLGGFYEQEEGAVVQIADLASIKGAAAANTLTANGLTDWSTAESGYPLPTALKTQIGALEVPALEPGAGVLLPDDDDQNNNNDNNNDDDDNADTTSQSTDTQAQTTDNTADTEEKKGGCGSVVGTVAVVMVAVAGTAVTVLRKKEQ